MDEIDFCKNWLEKRSRSFLLICYVVTTMVHLASMILVPLLVGGWLSQVIRMFHLVMLLLSVGGWIASGYRAVQRCIMDCLLILASGFYLTLVHYAALHPPSPLSLLLAASGATTYAIFGILMSRLRMRFLALWVLALASESVVALRTVDGGVVWSVIYTISLLLACCARWSLSAVANQAATSDYRAYQAKIAADQAVARALSMTISMVAHDVRKPFSMLKIGLDRLVAEAGDHRVMVVTASKIREHVGKAYSDVNRMLNDLMEVSGQRGSLNTEPTSLTAMIERSIHQVFRSDESCEARFDLRLDSLRYILVEPSLMERVLVNLLDNARQATRGPCDIWIGAQETQATEMMEIVVGNTGSYISPEQIQRIFEPYFTAGKRGGTGLGLAICRNIVTQHGGTIDCRSSHDVGTEFILRLPLADGESSVEVLEKLPKDAAEVRAAFLRSLGADDRLPQVVTTQAS